MKFQTHSQLAQVVLLYDFEPGALGQLSFHCEWHGMRPLQPDREGVDTFRVWLREQHFAWVRLCLEKVEGPAVVGLPDVLQHLPFVFGAFLGVRLSMPLACACGSLSRLRFHDAKHYTAYSARSGGR